MKKILIAFLFSIFLLSMVSATINFTVTSPTPVYNYRVIGQSVNLTYQVNSDNNLSSTWYNYNGVNTTLQTALYSPYSLISGWNKLGNSGSSGSPSGFRIVANANAAVTIMATKNPGTDVNKAYLYDSSVSTILAQSGFDANGNTSLNYSLVKGTTYYILANKTVGTYTIFVNSTGGLPINSSYIGVAGGYNAGDNSFAYTFDSITINAPPSPQMQFNESTTFAQNVSNTLTLYANDTSNNVQSQLVAFNYSILEINQTYNGTVASISTNPFYINLTYDPIYTQVNAILNYNYTNYSASTVYQNGNNIQFTASATSPSTAGGVPFYWIIQGINSSGSTIFTSTPINQTVNALAIDNCGTYTNVVLNFSMYDEETANQIKAPPNNNSYNVLVKIGDPTLTNYNSFAANYTNSTYATVCLQNPLTNSYRMDYTVQYSASNYVSRFYNIQNSTLSSAKMNQNVSLYNLLSANSQTFTINVLDKNYIALSGAVVEINRQYTQGANKIVESPLTDSNGQAIAHFTTSSSPYYTINIKQNGVTLATFLNRQVYCATPTISSCILQLNIPASTVSLQNLDSALGISYQTSYNQSSQTYTLQYQTTDGNSKTVTINGVLNNNLGNLSICSSSISGYSGILYCMIPGAYQNSSVIITGRVNNNLFFTDYLNTGFSHTTSLTTTRYILAAMLIPLIALMGVSSAALTLVFFVVGLIICAGIYLLDTQSALGAGSFIIWVIVFVVAILWKLNKGGAANG